MDPMFILSILFIFHPINGSIQKLNNPILPIRLGTTKVIVSKHTFVSYLNISDLFDMKHHLNIQLSFIGEKQNISNQSNLLLRQAYTLSDQIDHLLQTINPHVLSKRGLINIGGKIYKWLFGTLDDEDGQRIDTILNHLEKNDDLLKDAINNQISIAKEFMIQTNRTLHQIKSNILLTLNLIDKFQEENNEINVLHLIIDSLINFQSHLNQIVNAITFANFHRIHPTFLSLTNLNFIIKKMSTIYSNDQIATFKNQHSYYSFLGIQLLFSNERIIFLIHFPVLMPIVFQTYFLYPIPLQNKIISPPKPFLTLNESTGLYQYQEEPCPEIEDVCYCKNNLQSEEDCIVMVILKNKAANCTTLNVHLEKAIANQVTPWNVLFSTPSNVFITESCSVEKHHEVTPGSYLITIPDKCYFLIGNEKFVHGNDELTPMKVIQLPTLNISHLFTRPVKVKFAKMNLEEIQHLTAKMNTQHEVSLPAEPLPTQSMPIWKIVLICLAFCAATYFGVTCYYKSCFPYNFINYLRKRRNLHPNDDFELVSQPMQPRQPSQL